LSFHLTPILPRVYLRLRIRDRRELMHVQALVTEPLNDSTKAFSDGFPAPNEIELHAACERPIFEGPRHELRPVIHPNRARDGARGDRPIKRDADRPLQRARKRLRWPSGSATTSTSRTLEPLAAPALP
jgi:hypothetical protein